MPPKAAQPSARDASATSTSALVSSHHCRLPVWDDAQIAQENWGSILSATAAAGNAGDAAGDAGRHGSVKPKSSAGQPASGGHPAGPGAGAEGHYEDAACHQCVTTFIQVCQAHRAPSASPDSGAAEDAAVTWRRPVDIFRPFRPVVHRNATPFVNPYAADGELVPTQGKVEEEACRAPSSAGGAAGSGGAAAGGGGGGAGGGAANKKSTAGAARNTEASPAATETFHQQYPEAVTVLEDFVGDGVARWSHCSAVDAVRHYRALPVLMQPYDGALVAGCPETPAEAVGSRYSTALRHKLRQAEQLSALTEAPPFLMTALDSALLAVEQAQRYIPAGAYLWELVYPHAPGTCHPVYNPFGKYAVKLFVAGAFRKVVVDDRLPVDVLGRPLLSTTSLKELWPALIGKAIIKALGPVTGVQALAASPELIVSVLMGNWVPQYLSPRHDTVSTMEALLLYERHLRRTAGVHAPILPHFASAAAKGGGGDGAAAEEVVDGAAKKEAKIGAGGGGGGNAATAGSGGGAQANRRRSSAPGKRGASPTKNDGAGGDGTQGEPEPLVASEYCAATVDEPIPELDLYVCGLHAAPPPPAAATPRSAVGGAAAATSAHQLLTIHAIKPFRNTFALLLHTTPRIQLADGVFEKEKDADDVSALQRWVRHQSTSPSKALATSVSGGEYVVDFSNSATQMVVVDSARSPTVTSCWLTVEEFMAQVDQVVVWRVLEGKFKQTKSVTGEAVLQHNGLGPSADSGGGAVGDAGAAPAGKQQAPPAGGHKGPWPPRDEAPAASTAATSAQLAPLARVNAGRSEFSALYASTLSPTCVWWKLTAAAAVEAVVVVSCPTLPDAALKPSPEGTSSAAPPSQQSVAATARERRVDLHYFQWDRAEPLNHVGAMHYTDGALQSRVLRLRPGAHLLRVDLHNLQPADTVAFLSDAAMELQLSLTHDFSQDGFACVTDAGAYPAMPLHDLEYIWLKRVFTLTKPTTLTVVLATLDDSEDVAAHRRVNTATQHASAVAAPSGKAGAHGKGGAPPASPAARGGGGGNAASASLTSGVTSTKKNSAAVGSDGGKDGQDAVHASAGTGGDAAEAEVEPVGVTILRFTTLLLVNLDNPLEYRLGSAGRLVQLRLEPNEKGYLIIAFTSVPASAMPQATNPDTTPRSPPQLVDEDDIEANAGTIGQVPGAPSRTPDNAFTPQSVADVASAVGVAAAAPPLFPAGHWKLTLRSDTELQAFDTVVHNTHDVVVEADLMRGGSPVLFRRACVVVEPTHVSLSAVLRSPLPMPYTIRITRPGPPTNAELPNSTLTPATTTTTTTPAGGKGSNTVVSSMVGGESPAPLEESGGNVRTVFESVPMAGRLFVADVLLPCAHEGGAVKTAKTAGGASGNAGNTAAPTTYIIEAFVSQADVTAWNNQCQRHQATVFAQIRSNAEARAATMQQSDIDDFQQDPEGFLQRRKEAETQRRQQLTESAEKAVTHAQADAAAGGDTRGSRARSSSTSRRQSRRISNAVDSFIKDSFRRASSSTAEDGVSEAATMALLDVTDPSALVHLTTQLSFSSPRAELKEEAVALEPVVELRNHMKETMAWLQDRLGGATAAARAGRSGLTSAGSAGAVVGGRCGGCRRRNQRCLCQRQNAGAAESARRGRCRRPLRGGRPARKDGAAEPPKLSRQPAAHLSPLLRGGGNSHGGSGGGYTSGRHAVHCSPQRGQDEVTRSRQQQRRRPLF